MKNNLCLFLLICIVNAQIAEEPKNSPISLLSNIKKFDNIIEEDLSVFNMEWVDSLKILLPCANVPVPKRTMRLPNAPRDYRSGTHRGIDFFANWGTPVRSVADGIVVRSDNYYEEVPPGFRENLLKSSARIGNTPSDIFNNVLLGKAVFLDHGFDLIPGFRTITIYAHLSSIEKGVKAGKKIKQGELLGKSGNTGMRESTLGSKAGSHLHWEMILQNGENEIYLGKDVPNPELYNMLIKIFNQK